MKNMKKITKYSAVAIVLLAGFIIPAVSNAQYYYPALQVSCQPNSYSIQTDNSIGWSASVSGGNGAYSYSWSGTDGLFGYSSYVSQNYISAGTKTANVTVTSNGQSVTANCGNVNVYPTQSYYYPYYSYPTYAALDGSCTATVSSANAGNTINWSASASGGNGAYNYYWTDSYNNSYSGQYVSQYYQYTGLEYMNLVITSNGQSVTRTCSVDIIPSTVANTSTTYTPTYTTPTTNNQVLSYNDTNTNLSSVYLSSVPYTGFDDVTSSILFISILLLWSAMLAYMFLKNKSASEVLATENVSSISANSEKVKTKISNEGNELKQIEDYARLNKVLLSSDASIKIFKLSKLGKINASETIKKMSGTDWTAVGENDLEKYI